MNRNRLKKYVQETLRKMEMDDAGSTRQIVDAVKANDGRMGEFAEELLDAALISIVGYELRHAREGECQGRLFHSVEKVVGIDDEGNAITERSYLRFDLVYENINMTNGVIDAYVRRSREMAAEANRTTIAARHYNPEFQRGLPFPDLEDGEELEGA